jgi:hypothetical protein
MANAATLADAIPDRAPPDDAVPNAPSSIASVCSVNSHALMVLPNRIATPSTRNAAVTASATWSTSDAPAPPRSSTPRIGRYSAISRSSATSSDSIPGVSRLPSQPCSSTSLATMPDAEA